MIKYSTRLKPFARQLRKNQTRAEHLLWNGLRRKQILGLQFYRQRVIGNYIVDFYCPKAKLIVEVDGSQHYDPQGRVYDQKRDDYLRSLGLNVLRFNNLEVLHNTETIVGIITDKILGKAVKITHGEYFEGW